MILTTTKHHENLLRDSPLSLLSIVEFFSSSEIKMIQKIPNKTFSRFTRYQVWLWLLAPKADNQSQEVWEVFGRGLRSFFPWRGFLNDWPDIRCPKQLATRVAMMINGDNEWLIAELVAKTKCSRKKKKKKRRRNPCHYCERDLYEWVTRACLMLLTRYRTENKIKSLRMDASLTVYAFVMQKILGRADSIKFKKEKKHFM